MGLRLGKLISEEGGGGLKAAVDGRPLYNCSLSGLDFRNEVGVDLVISCYKTSCFFSAKRDNRIILTFNFANKTMIMIIYIRKIERYVTETRSPQV